MAEKKEALAKYLDIDPEEIQESSYDACLFEISPRKCRQGTSPNTIKRTVETTKKALALAFPSHDTSKWPAKLLNERVYRFINRAINKRCPDMLKIGVHDVLNTLYYLYAEQNYEQSKEYQKQVIAAWEGEKIKDNRPIVSVNSGEYLVLTDAEAEERYEQWLDSYLEDCVLSEMPETARNYFDRDAWKRDARIDGRGFALASYDGDENEQDGFYIFRIN